MNKIKNTCFPLTVNVDGYDIRINKNGEVVTGKLGKPDEAKGGYDMAGNVLEWTMEVGNSTGRVLRCGSCAHPDSDNPASYHQNIGTSFSNYDVGFRVALYVEL